MTETQTFPASPQRFIQIDEEGYFMMDALRVADAEAGRDWMKRVSIDERGRAWTSIAGEPVMIEAFDEPYVALDIEKGPAAAWQVTVPYGHSETFDLTTLTLDEWDRFHGRTERGVPFVLSRPAQARFFNLVDDFDDESIEVSGFRIETKPWLEDNTDVTNQNWWAEFYRNDTAPWDLKEPSTALPKLVPQLKLQRMRILVPGAGSGNDAAWFAEQGHLVTAVDFSEEAVAKAKAKYSHLTNLKIVQGDVFNLPASFNSSFDIVFEHTLYCAILPSRRNDLLKVWRRVLAEQGHLMGVFFTFDKRRGPPYGGSEWEIRQRLDKSFRPLYWMRLRDSRESRMGQELFVYAEKKSTF